MLAAVEAALSELPERQRIVVRLRVHEGKSPAGVRAAIGAVSVKAVERTYSRALKALRKNCSVMTKGIGTRTTDPVVNSRANC